MVQIFESEFFSMVWPDSPIAYLVLGVTIFLLMLNFTIRALEFVALKRRSKCAEGKESRYENPSEGVSVIITVNNNAELISKNLPRFLEQDYPDYEVIVVDEASDDDSVDRLNILAAKYPNLKVSRLYPGVKFHRTKKIALNIGILGARNEILLFSEIYCTPPSQSWVREMASSFSDRCGVVIGDSSYPVTNRLVDLLRWNHNMHRINAAFLNFFGYIPGCDWTNYGYRKSLYMACRGFSKNNQHILGYESEIILKILHGFAHTVAFNRSENGTVLYSDDRHQLRADEEYYYVEKRHWQAGIQFLSDIAQWVRFLVYCAIIVLNPLFGFAYWFVTALFILTFFVDFLCINLQMSSMLQKKLFLTSLMSTTIGYFGRWCYRIKTLVSESQWK